MLTRPGTRNNSETPSNQIQFFQGRRYVGGPDFEVGSQGPWPPHFEVLIPLLLTIHITNIPLNFYIQA